MGNSSYRFTSKANKVREKDTTLEEDTILRTLPNPGPAILDHLFSFITHAYSHTTQGRSIPRTHTDNCPRESLHV